MILVQVRRIRFCWVRQKYAIVFRTQFRITSASQEKTDVGFAILIKELPVCVFGQDEILCSQPIEMDQHSIKNVKSPVNKFDVVNKAYVDCTKFISATGTISNTVLSDHTLFTFPDAKGFIS